MSKHVVIEENCRGFFKYHVLPYEQYIKEYNNGDWSHYTYERVLEFDSKEDAENYIKEQEDNTYVLALDREGYFIVPYWQAENVFTQPSLFDVIYIGDLKKCEELKNKYEEEMQEED